MLKHAYYNHYKRAPHFNKTFSVKFLLALIINFQNSNVRQPVNHFGIWIETNIG